MRIVLLLFMGFASLLADIKKVTLEEAIKIALENNKNSKVSKISLDIAKAQYNQALSANYPSINAMFIGNRQKKDMEFQMRGNIALPSELSTLLGNIIQANPALIQAQPELASADFSTIKMDDDVKAAGRDTLIAKLQLQYVLYSGGEISSIINQAKLNKLLAQNTIKRDESQVKFDVKKYFYASMLTNELYSLAKKTLNRMEYTAELTKDFYEMGESLNVKKTDYLAIQVTVSLLKSLVAKIESNKILVNSALVNTMGLKYNTELEIVYSEDEFYEPKFELNKVIQQAYKNNTNIKELELALKISKEQINEKKADHLPSIALRADASHTNNSYKYGFLNDDDSNSWSVSAVVNVPLFNGFKTTNEVKEKRLEQKKYLLLKDMLEEAIALQVKSELSNSMIAYKQMMILKEANNLASQNRELNIKAYQIDAVKPEKVIESQYMEAYTKADYLTYLHNYLLSLAKIDLLVGKNLK